MEWMSLLMFAALCVVLLMGYPVALSLAGVALAFAGFGAAMGADIGVLPAIVSRVYGKVMMNESLIAIPTFVFMGLTLQKAKIAEDLLDTMSLLFGGIRGGLAYSIIIVGALLAAATGIVGATVVTMGVLSLPLMLKRGYSPSLSCGAICASGTLGQIIPPSIVLIILGDVIGNSYSQAQLEMGNFSPDTVSISDLFSAAIVPSLGLICLYLIYIFIRGIVTPAALPVPTKEERKAMRGDKFYLRFLVALMPPIVLVLCVLGSIIIGFATPTEAASIGALGAMILAFIRYFNDKRKGNKTSLRWLIEVPRETLQITAMIAMIMIGASLFSLVFLAFGGDQLVEELMGQLPGGVFGAMFCVMAAIFLLGFMLDFFEIVYVVVPIVAPILFKMGVDPVWLSIMLAVNLQTSFLTPPFGFALFFLRGVAPKSMQTSAIYKGVLPFIALQLFMLVLLAIFPSLSHINLFK